MSIKVLATITCLSGSLGCIASIGMITIFKESPVMGFVVVAMLVTGIKLYKMW